MFALVKAVLRAPNTCPGQLLHAVSRQVRSGRPVHCSWIARLRSPSPKPVTIFCMGFSRAHLRRAGPDGPGREQRGRTWAVEREERPGWPAVGGQGFTRGPSPVRGGSFRRVLRTQVLRRGGCRARHPPVTGRLRIPAVSRCRARQHHGQAVSVAPDGPITGKMSEPPGRNAAQCPGWPLQPTVLHIPLRATRLRARR